MNIVFLFGPFDCLSFSVFPRASPLPPYSMAWSVALFAYPTHHLMFQAHCLGSFSRACSLLFSVTPCLRLGSITHRCVVHPFSWFGLPKGSSLKNRLGYSSGISFPLGRECLWLCFVAIDLWLSGNPLAILLIDQWTIAVPFDQACMGYAASFPSFRVLLTKCAFTFLTQHSLLTNFVL